VDSSLSRLDSGSSPNPSEQLSAGGSAAIGFGATIRGLPHYQTILPIGSGDDHSFSCATRAYVAIASAPADNFAVQLGPFGIISSASACLPEHTFITQHRSPVAAHIDSQILNLSVSLATLRYIQTTLNLSLSKRSEPRASKRHFAVRRRCIGGAAGEVIPHNLTMSTKFSFVPYLLWRKDIVPVEPWVLMGRSSEPEVSAMYPGEPQIYPSDMFAGKFWFVGLPAKALNHPPFAHAGDPPKEISDDAGTYQTASTEEIGTILEHGFSVGIISGPFDTRDRAHYSLDLFMESGE